MAAPAADHALTVHYVDKQRQIWRFAVSSFPGPHVTLADIAIHAEWKAQELRRSVSSESAQPAAYHFFGVDAEHTVREYYAHFNCDHMKSSGDFQLPFVLHVVALSVDEEEHRVQRNRSSHGRYIYVRQVETASLKTSSWYSVSPPVWIFLSNQETLTDFVSRLQPHLHPSDQCRPVSLAVLTRKTHRILQEGKDTPWNVLQADLQGVWTCLGVMNATVADQLHGTLLIIPQPKPKPVALSRAAQTLSADQRANLVSLPELDRLAIEAVLQSDYQAHDQDEERSVADDNNNDEYADGSDSDTTGDGENEDEDQEDQEDSYSEQPKESNIPDMSQVPTPIHCPVTLGGDECIICFAATPNATTLCCSLTRCCSACLHQICSAPVAACPNCIRMVYNGAIFGPKCVSWNIETGTETVNSAVANKTEVTLD